jgi:hypothetical protein
MPSRPFVPRFSPAALGATLLGVSAALLAVDVAGTFVLDERHAARVAPESVPLASAASAPALVPQSAPAAATPKTAFVALVTQHVAAPQHVAALRRPTPAARGASTSARSRLAALPRRTGGKVAQRSSAPTSEHTANRQQSINHPRAIAAAQPPLVRPAANVMAPHVAPHVATVTPSGASNREPRVREIASLRDVRRFVIRKLDADGTRVCAISATAYTALDGHVIVDLVMRNRKARWTEKAVVRRNGTGLKLLGVKIRAMPYRTLAANGIKPGQ